MGSTRCPGSDRSRWGRKDIFEVSCPRCRTKVEFFADDVRRNCPDCGQLIPNPRLITTCASWCPHADKCSSALARLRTKPGRPGLESVRILREEHRLIARSLDSLERSARAILGGGAVDGEFFRKVFDFVEGFVCGVHQEREEELFRLMEKRGFPGSAGPLAVMDEQHEETRAFVPGMLRLLPPALRGDAAASRMLAENALAYVRLFRSHVEKEEAVLYHTAERLLSAEDDCELASRFGEVDERWRKLANEMAEGVDGDDH